MCSVEWATVFRSRYMSLQIVLNKKGTQTGCKHGCKHGSFLKNVVSYSVVVKD
ncbi:hypothetical protein DAPPUDRAFT_252566 [Daphnia pulex]|uniref:Uncharacterized protein n=1 Tax=Daphnia pulex TaxID=6669 RepID=E9H300_DAPPU|nr:hypothetical protein DAPPUDRAFT_252566 [Daphnia pulex]|eukprot:EFX73872.1 hypothetical protein DAPPUDRAFT_252566 [Daphnia pulex]